MEKEKLERLEHLTEKINKTDIEYQEQCRLLDELFKNPDIQIQMSFRLDNGKFIFTEDKK